ncbi:MAG TPA: glycosyltransferase [Patescibacteria group bacterium]|nr:glycosyltransferase [Patescibacteria group bacterium]
MRLMLIKIGKIWSVLRRDGLLRGGRRVLSACMALFKRVKPGDILFVTGGVGDSARYRTTNVSETLKVHGFTVAVTVQDNPFLTAYADKFSVFVFHRVLYTSRVAKLIEKIKTQKKEIIFDTDDLVYDPQFLKYMDYFQKMNLLERKLYENGVGGEILADPYVTVCTTTTTFLAQKLREKGKRVLVVRNRMSEEDVTNAHTILKSTCKDTTCVRVCYFSGTPSHNKDFATISDALITLLQKYPQMRLVLAGPLDTEDKLTVYQQQIERVPFAPRKEYFETLARMDINLAPLEIGNPFCESKSELKWFEAGLVSVPTIAAATQTFTEAITDGTDGFVARTTPEWIEKIENLILDVSLRERMGHNARVSILARYTTKSADDTEYYNYLREKRV